MAPNPTGLFIIRAWIEQGSQKTLRAHIRLTTDVGTGFESEVTLTDVAGICAAVELWLLDVMATERTFD